MNDFAVFIPTHGRSDKQLTLKALRGSGYTGDVWLVVDDLDEQKDDYVEKYGESVLIFDKREYERKTDAVTNRTGLHSLVYARNAIEDFAKQKNVRFYFTVDDDIDKFVFRYENDGKLKSRNVSNFDVLVEKYVEFMRNGKIACVGMGNSSTLIGGLKSFNKAPKRRCFGAFFRNVDIPIKWISAMNEDYITEVCEGVKGALIFEVPNVIIETKGTASGKAGGCEQVYKAMNEYERAFYAVIACPSAFYVKGKRGGFCISKRPNSLPNIISSGVKK